MKKKSWLTLGCTLALGALFMAGCGGNGSNDDTDTSGATGGGGSDDTSEVAEMPEMTDEDITLSFAAWMNLDLQRFMVDKFMEKYPNITVNIVELEQDTWNDGLTNLANAGNLPDAYWYLGNVDVPIVNGWLGDMTEYWEADPETANVLDTMQDTGYFDGERKMAAASNYYPYTVFLDENLFDSLNVEMPSADWKYSEMIDLMKKMTVPEQGIYGYNDFTLIETMAPIVQQDAIGEFGWDGESFDMTSEWADAIEQQAKFVRTGVHAPFFDTDEAEAAFGDRLLWAAETGKIAMQLDAWWTKNLFATDEFVDKGISWVPYPVPQGDNASTNRKPAFIDFGSISSATEHPREAYELLKFMGWGNEGFTARMEGYATLVNENGDKIFAYPDTLPLTNDQESWDAVAANLPDNDYYKNYLEYMREPVALGGATLPGFQTYLDEVQNGGEYGVVSEAVINGEVNAHDIAGELTEKLNQYHQDALAEIF